MIKRTNKAKKTSLKITEPFINVDELKTGYPFIKLAETEETIEYYKFDRDIIQRIKRPYLTIKNSVFNHHVFIDCEFNNAHVWDVRFENCDLSNLSFSKSSFHRVEFVSCKLLGTNFSESTFNHIHIKESNGNYINISMSKLENIRISGCDLTNGSLIYNKPSSVEFENCLLRNTDFSHTPLRNIDLRTSKIEGIQVNLSDLRGAIVNSLQAMDLLPLLGVIINDEMI